MTTFQLRLLGGAELRDPAGRPVEALVRQPKRMTLLAHLVLCSADFYPRRDTIMALFWPDLDAERARHSLRQSLYFIRQCTDAGVFETRGSEEIRIDRSRLWCDVWALQDALAADRLKEAQTLYRGDLMEGLHASDVSPQLEQLFETRRQRLRERIASAAWELAERAAADTDPLEVHHWGRRAVELSPEVESAYRRLIQLLDWIGDGAAAMEAHRTLEDRLESELGVAPSPETTRLVDQVLERRLRGDPPRFPPRPLPALARTGVKPLPRPDDAANEMALPEVDRLTWLAAFLLLEIAVLALVMFLA
jgi:DNA-binding SARP family transcriptional activator